MQYPTLSPKRVASGFQLSNSFRHLFLSFFLLFCFPGFSQKYDAEVLNKRTDATIQNGTLITDYSYEIQINNRSGEKYGRIAIPFSGMIRLSNISAIIKDEHGNVIRKLKRNEITQRSYISDFSFYEDDFIKEFTLKHNTYPYIIEYSYTYKENEFIHIASWNPVYNTEIPTRKATLSLIYPTDYEIKYTSCFVEDPVIESLELNTKITWETNFTETFEEEDYAPYYRKLIPGIEIVPLNFKYGKKGSFDSWKTYGYWQYSLMEDMNILPQGEINNIKQIINGADTDYKKVRRIYHYLQDHTRYINVSIKTGGLKPYPASYVAENKYGDCKALSNYFKVLLEVAGINSYYTKVWAGEPLYNIDTTFPSAQFNHIIISVPLEKDTLWLDCTSDGPFNYMGTFTQGRKSFIIKKDSSVLQNTPALNFSDVKEERTVNIDINLALEAKLTFKNTYRGDMFEWLRYISKNYPENEKNKKIRKYYVRNGQEVINYDIIHEHRDSTRILFNMETSSGNLCKKYGNDILVKNIPFDVPDFEKPLNRKLPVQLDYPVFKTDTIIYNLPDGTSINSTLSSKVLSSKYGNYQLKYQQENNTVIVIKELKISKGNYPLSEYKDFYAFIEGVTDFEHESVFMLTR